MDQDEIYNLLLLVLLMSNSRGDSDSGLSNQGAVNELILASMLLNNLNSGTGSDSTDTDGRRCTCSHRNQNNGNTTF